MACNQHEEVTTDKSFQQIISTLPVNLDDGVCKYKGFWFPIRLMERILSLEESFKCKETDVLICGFTKTGTTWLKSLCFAISTRTNFDAFTTPLRSYLCHDIIPFIEFQTNQEEKNPKKSPYQEQFPLFSTHLPFCLLSESVKSSGCKIIYICRDPKDTLVSLWHFVNRLGNDQTLDSVFKCFSEGNNGWGPYWEHVLEYWKASIEMPEKILFLKYEDLKNDTVFYVRRIAEFIGKPFSNKEEEEGMAEKIAKFCRFESMSNLEVNKSKGPRPHGPFEVNNNAFFRKGIVGDWRNALTAEMIEKIDEITEKKMSVSGFKFGASV
ncbi:hypothetical protein M9H77_07423 [Catharanthus roseus]|uniref:Uncharacterized protein n=1 Tax=Catharanthus roseus TaxID=4058 RepID=A0ACC0BV66_CATRO|nr:hypothetical protein M9H77_07423 [Catharanthus roseus]